jgi:hypothetical protein
MYASVVMTPPTVTVRYAVVGLAIGVVVLVVGVQVVLSITPDVSQVFPERE